MNNNSPTLTRRDELAAIALRGILSSLDWPANYMSVTDPDGTVIRHRDKFVELAYDYADAMLAYGAK